MRCPVCKNFLTTEKQCPCCGFDELHMEFLSKEEAEFWHQSKVLTYRAKWQATSSRIEEEPKHSDIVWEEYEPNPKRNDELPLQRLSCTTKQVMVTVVWCLIVAVVFSSISLPSLIEKQKEYKREASIELQIQEITTLLEQKIESQIDDDVIISYSYKQFDDSNDFLVWSFKIKMTKFEEFRSSDGNNEILLREIMDNCRIINDIIEDENETFNFNVEFEDKYIDISNYDGTVSYGDLSSYETFYYEEYGSDRYLHSFDTEYIIKNIR